MHKILSDYTINTQTLCLIPFRDKLSMRYFTLVMETEHCYLVKSAPLGIIVRSCTKNGLNYRKLSKTAKKLLRKTCKIPCLISANPCLVMFPTCGTRNVSQCYYISITQISEILIEHTGTSLTFSNGEKLKIKLTPDCVKTMIENSYAVLGYHAVYDT